MNGFAKIFITFLKTRFRNWCRLGIPFSKDAFNAEQHTHSTESSNYLVPHLAPARRRPGASTIRALWNEKLSLSICFLCVVIAVERCAWSRILLFIKASLRNLHSSMLLPARFKDVPNVFCTACRMWWMIFVCAVHHLLLVTIFLRKLKREIRLLGMDVFSSLFYSAPRKMNRTWDGWRLIIFDKP